LHVTNNLTVVTDSEMEEAIANVDTVPGDAMDLLPCNGMDVIKIIKKLK
jgi:hypothetical protein